jgi:hypothetical protein
MSRRDDYRGLVETLYGGGDRAGLILFKDAEEAALYQVRNELGRNLDLKRHQPVPRPTPLQTLPRGR